mmetsp:Transcript_25844/g.76384  ORF Transcript_25844/g.76384 Transcript_25844/m.76384 type:complete len:200 (+) Transcript_25844:1854-2453(+)
MALLFFLDVEPSAPQAQEMRAPLHLRHFWERIRHRCFRHRTASSSSRMKHPSPHSIRSLTNNRRSSRHASFSCPSCPRPFSSYFSSSPFCLSSCLSSPSSSRRETATLRFLPAQHPPPPRRRPRPKTTPKPSRPPSPEPPRRTGRRRGRHSPPYPPPRPSAPSAGGNPRRARRASPTRRPRRPTPTTTCCRTEGKVCRL